jgi:hypothetical protein
MSTDLFGFRFGYFIFDILIVENLMKDDAMSEQPNTKKSNNRLAYIDFQLYFLGTLTRSDLISRFGIREAAATRDIADYKQQAPRNLEYDAKNKIYKRLDTFQPIFTYSPDKVLSLLAYGFGSDFLSEQEPLLLCETPAQLNRPNLSILSVLTRAIHQKKAVKMEYHSPNSGISTRQFAPFVLVNTGLRWHVRGLDRKYPRFADFVITRILSIEILEAPLDKNERKEFDIQWNRVLELEIVPHPNLKYPESIKADYNMQDGVLNINIRAAVAGYFLRLWNIDCSKDHKLRPTNEETEEGKQYQLWLRNWQCLYRIENAAIAPGYNLNHFGG